MANITRRNPGQTDLPATTTGTRSWDPFQMMRELLRFEPLGQAAPWIGDRGVGFVPTFDVKETKDGYLFRADLPGVKEQDLDISLTGNRLTVAGKREMEHEEQGETWYAFERSYGNFTRSFTLPEDVSSGDVRADLKDGVLTLVLPKRPEAQPKKISVTSSTDKGGKAKA